MVFKSKIKNRVTHAKGTRLNFIPWQPGYLIKTRGFPSSDRSKFGFIIDKLLLYPIILQ